MHAVSPALILMDVHLPEMDGLEVIRRLRANPEWADLPIIALTALAMPGDQERCLAAGANDYISKPVRLETLRQIIATYLGSE
jgi:CheY-like chemotaxis protein